MKIYPITVTRSGLRSKTPPKTIEGRNDAFAFGYCDELGIDVFIPPPLAKKLGVDVQDQEGGTFTGTVSSNKHKHGRLVGISTPMVAEVRADITNSVTENALLSAHAALIDDKPQKALDILDRALDMLGFDEED